MNSTNKKHRNLNHIRKQNESPQIQPSLRQSEDFDEIEVPLELQTLAATHLDQMLEESLKTTKPTTNPVAVKRKKKKNKIRLFTNSKQFLEISNDKSHNLSVKTHNKRPINDVSSDDDIDKLKSVVVEPEYVMSGVEVSVWAKRTRKTNFRYKRQSNGILTYIDTTS